MNGRSNFTDCYLSLLMNSAGIKLTLSMDPNPKSILDYFKNIQ